MKNRYGRKDSLRGGTGVILQLLVALFCVALGVHPLMAQEGPHVQGVVKDATTGSTMPGVNVLIKGTTQGVATDLNGKYTLSISSPTDTLIFSYIGYQTKVVPINGRSTINIKLESEAIKGQEMVVLGYNAEKKENVTAAISQVKTAQIANKPVANETNNLVGRVAGVIAVQNSGEPGYNSSDIHIRGISTIGNSNPLVVVDGVPRSFSEINPENIKFITVLKGAAAVAPYGMAGANGVILVTTKSGLIGKPTLTYDGYFGIQNPTFVPKMVNAYQFALLKNEAQANVGGQPSYSQAELQGFKAAVNGTVDPQYPNSDALHTIIRNNAPMTRNSLILSGGTKYKDSRKVVYYASLGWTYQGGMWTTDNIHRYNASLRIDADVTKTTHASLFFNGWNEQQHYPATSAGTIMYQAYRTPAVSPVYYANGDWGSWDGRSLVGYAYHSGFQTNKNRQVYSSIYIKQDLPFLPGLDVKARISYDPYDSFQKTWNTPVPTYKYDPTTKTYNEGFLLYSKPQLSQYYDRTNNYVFQGYLDYVHSFGKHNVNLTAVYEADKSLDQNFGAFRQNYNLNIPELNDGSSIPADLSNSGLSSQTRRMGVVFQGNYNYANTYLLTVSGRYDGSYYFAPGHRFGFFPAISAGWNVANEKFIVDRFPWLTTFKLRGSWGYSGNLAGSAFQYLSTYGIGQGANFNGAPTQALYEQNPANPFITWEKALMEDVGFDMSLWSDKLTASVDYFYQKRSNMLVNPTVTVPSSYGIGLNQVNAGVMSNHGLELSVGYNKAFENGLVMNLDGNFTWAHNKLINIFEANDTYNNPNRRRTGRQFGTMFGYKAIGLYTKSDFNPDGSLKSGIATPAWGTVRPGDIMYADLSGPNGKPDGKITPDDRTVIGNPRTPGINYGLDTQFQYKQFGLDLLFQGAAQTSFYMGGWIQSPFNANGNVTLLQYNNHWSPSNPNPNALFPRVSPAITANNSQGSSFWVKNADYLRLKSAELSFTMPSSLAHKLTIRSMQIYVAAQNLFTWSPGIPYNLDPEASSSSGQYYFQQRVISVGANIHF
ncbi:MAG TPA: TonB-dependent receptor [Balneolales bacterium]|nr:TonB-dependent receptor [Balneolales bacterium]